MIAVYRRGIAALGLLFALAFVVVVVPPLWASGDIVGALAAGFVNPFASGYALDAIICWCILALWVIHDARHEGVRHGWVALVLGLVPGVATGLAFYLLLRLRRHAPGAGA